MADFLQNAKGGPFAKFSKWPIFLAELQRLHILHVPNLTQMSENNRFFLFASDSARVKCDV